jgi:two-component system, chemotaxis family, chemotaxis protein CheY
MSVVLVVEDDSYVRDAILEVLTDSGYTPVGAANGAEALARLGATSEAPAVILLDLMMPVMDGWQFRARQQGDPTLAAIPVVVLTAQPNIEESARALRAAGTLKKPVQLDVLLATVARFCGAGR